MFSTESLEVIEVLSKRIVELKRQLDTQSFNYDLYLAESKKVSELEIKIKELQTVNGTTLTESRQP
jgi:hypothetical protein